MSQKKKNFYFNSAFLLKFTILRYLYGKTLWDLNKLQKNFKYFKFFFKKKYLKLLFSAMIF